MSSAANTAAREAIVYPHGDAIWEHKKGRVWALVARMERENRWLRYQVRVLQARQRRVGGAAS